MPSTDIRRIHIKTGSEIEPFVESATPVVLQGAFDDTCLENYKCLETFVERFSDLPVTVSRNYLDETLEAVMAYCRRGKHDTTNTGFRSTTSKYQSTVSEYVSEIHSNPQTTNLITEQPANGNLFDDLRVPKVLKALRVDQLRHGGTKLTQKDAGCWWFLANAGNASDLHTDWDGCHVLNHQVFGRKRWILFPPSSADRLGVVDIFPTIMPREMSEQQINAFLPYAGGVQTVLQPGETIYIPPFYYHHAEYIDHAMGFAFRFRPPPDEVRNLRLSLHCSPAIQSIFSLAIKDLDQAKPALAALEEACQASYPNAILKYRSIENIAQEFCSRLGLLENYWKLPPALFLEPFLASRYRQSRRKQTDTQSTSAPGLTDAAIHTEPLRRNDRAANSAVIETNDDGPFIPQHGWVGEDSLSERVRKLLHPFSLDDFFARYFEQSWLRVERGEVSRPHEGLYSVNSLLEDFRQQRMPLQSIRFAANTASGNRILLPQKRFSLESLNPDETSDRPPSPVHFERIAEYIENETGSLLVLRIEQFVSQINELAAELGEALRTSTQVNAYYTPRSARTLDLHWDTHDVIVLQVEGRKHWKIFETLVPLPIEQRDYMASTSFEGYGETLESETFELEPGDWMYLPRGVPHLAWTEDAPSLHLTVGLQHPTWIDVLQDAVSEALRNCEKQLSFRRVCPAVFPNVKEQDYRRVFEKLAGNLGQQLLNVDLRRLVAKQCCPSPLIFAGQREVTLDEHTVLSRVPCVHFRHHEEQGPRIEFHGKLVRFPPTAAAAIDFVATRRNFSVHQIPGLSAEEQLVLARRLIREGFLRTK